VHAAQNTCPPDPASFSNLDGGLVVTGPCHLINVTVNGGVTITPTGRLELENSTVNGGIDIQAGGELDAGHMLTSTVSTYLPNTINGGINATAPSNIDLNNATVNGKTSVNGGPTGGATGAFAFGFCGSTFEGSVTWNNVVSSVVFPSRIGDPGEAFQLGPHLDCPGNTIDGSLFVSNTVAAEFEGNQIMGSVHISNSTVELAGNTIEGSAHCSNVIVYTDADHTPNTTGGSNNCP
jgi:hypothetical protein